MTRYQEYPGLQIRRLTTGDIPVLDFLSLKNHTLGKKYQLSLVFADPKTSEELHKTWKGKPGPADILSFPFSDTEGEIVMSLSQARKTAKNFDRSYNNFILFLFIHGMVHLKGYDHGSTMESIEEKIRQKFDI